VEADGIQYAPPPGLPAAARRPAVLEVHGVSRVDDYAWLRHVGDPQTVDYLASEQAFYDRAIARLAPIQVELEAEMTSRLPTVDASVAWRRAGIVYFTRSRRGAEQERLFRYDASTGGEQLIFDPNTLASAGRRGPRLVEPSPDASVVAYTVPDERTPGAGELRFRDVATGLDLADRVRGVGVTGSWSSDSHVFVYVCHNGLRGYAVGRHVLGTTGAQDEPLLTEDDPRFSLRVHGSQDGAWILVTSAAADSSEVHLLRADRAGAAPRLVAPRRPGVRYDVEPLPGGWDGAGEDRLLLVTDDGAPEFRLLQAPVPADGRAGDTRDWAAVPGLRLAPSERLDYVVVMVRHVLLGIRRDGEPFLRVVDRPAPGTDLPARPATREVHPGVPFGQLRLWQAGGDPDTTSVVIVEENLVTAPAWVEVDLSTGARTVVKRTPLVNVDPTRYVTERLFVTAPDGMQVPVTMARRRDARRGRTTGLLLTGFGAFEQCRWPGFDPATLSMLDRNLVVAVAHVRGGGELGRSWWEGARGRNKQRTFVDLFAVRDALVAAGWAGEVRGGARVVVRGESAGGLLAAAVYSRGPRMWRAVVAETPLVDPVTAVVDPTVPTPPGLAEEWGDPVGDPDDFAAMLAWCPYDNLPPAGRPPLLVTAVRDDPRHPLHEAARWVARLRATDHGRSPSTVLLRVDPGTGARLLPGNGPAVVRYEAEILAWVLDQLGLA
jgi:oligopeptidase B